MRCLMCLEEPEASRCHTTLCPWNVTINGMRLSPIKNFYVPASVTSGSYLYLSEYSKLPDVLKTCFVQTNHNHRVVYIWKR
jgi:hypothetical protein